MHKFTNKQIQFTVKQKIELELRKTECKLSAIDWFECPIFTSLELSWFQITI